MTVFDPFCGSGTTLLTSFLQKRFSIGYDLSKKFLARLRNIGTIKDKDFCYETVNSMDLMQKLQNESINYIISSPLILIYSKTKHKALGQINQIEVLKMEQEVALSLIKMKERIIWKTMILMMSF